VLFRVADDLLLTFAFLSKTTNYLTCIYFLIAYVCLYILTLIISMCSIFVDGQELHLT
jgi:hypothetical protein